MSDPMTSTTPREATLDEKGLEAAFAAFNASRGFGWQKIKAAIRAYLSHASVTPPEGYVLVPRTDTMEDLKKLDDEIVRLAFRLFDTERGSPEHEYARTDLFAAVAAKRSASRPKLLSAEEADAIWDGYPDGTDLLGILQAVLDADRASILKVIEGLPDSGHPTEKWVRVADIRSALSTREG